MFKTSSDKLKVMYQNKAEKLNEKSEHLFLLWSEMELKYAEQLSKGSSKNKELLNRLLAERKKYKAQLNGIRIDVLNMMASMKRQKRQSSLI
jgi:hypothetical protein